MLRAIVVGITTYISFLCPVFSMGPQHQYRMEAQQARKNPLSTRNALFLVSFPRSGQHWMKFVVQAISERPIYALNSYTHEPLPHMKHSFSKRPCYVMHNPHWIWKIPPEHNKLIAVVRNYKECFVREARAENRHPKSVTELLNLPINKLTFANFYLDIIKLYDQWNPENRLLIYYEDLIGNPETIANKLAAFLGEPLAKARSFIENHQKIAQYSINFYNRIQKKEGGSMTGGKKAIHHSSYLTDEEKTIMDEIMKEKGNDLFTKYLLRYSSSKTKEAKI